MSAEASSPRSSRIHFPTAVSLGALVAFVGSLVLFWLAEAGEGATWRPDLAAFYTAWTMVLDGQGGQIYDLDLQARYQDAIPELAKYKGSLLGFYNPPFVAAFFAPLALLSMTTAFWVWTGGQALLLAFLLRWMAGVAASWERNERLFLFGAVLAFLPLFMTIYKGAFSLLVLVGLIGAYESVKRADGRWAGPWLSSALVKPQLVLLVSGMLLGARRWAALATLALATIALIIASAALLGPAVWLEYAKLLSRSATFFNEYGVVPHTMYNVRGVLSLALGADATGFIATVTSVVLLAAGILIVVLWARPWQPDTDLFDLRMAFTLGLGFLASPHGYQYDAVVLILSAVLFYRFLRARQIRTGAYRAFVLIALLVFSLTAVAGAALGVVPPIVIIATFVSWTAVELLRASYNSA